MLISNLGCMSALMTLGLVVPEERAPVGLHVTASSCMIVLDLGHDLAAGIGVLDAVGLVEKRVELGVGIAVSFHATPER
jgi:hypothetical protein